MVYIITGDARTDRLVRELIERTLDTDIDVVDTDDPVWRAMEAAIVVADAYGDDTLIEDLARSCADLHPIIFA